MNPELQPGRVIALVAVLVTLFATSPIAQRTATITLAWDASADEVSGYQVHIGRDPGNYTETVDVGGQTEYVYRAIPGGRYYFAVTSYTLDGGSSFPSAEVMAVARPGGSAANAVNSSGEAGATAQSASEAGSDSHGSCGAGGCYAARVLATSRSLISALSVADDGSLLWVEEDREAFLLQNGAGTARLLMRAAPGTRIADLAAAPHFAADPRMVAAIVDANHAPAPELTVTRYAVTDAGVAASGVVATLPLSAASEPRLAIDFDGRIYVAMPRTADRRDPYSGAILRFNADGTVPAGQRAASPIIAQGYERPDMLAVDRRQLWAAGSSDVWTHRLSRVAIDASTAGTWPAAPEPIDTARTMKAQAEATPQTRSVGQSDEFAVVAYVDREGTLQVVDRSSGAQARLAAESLAGVSSPTAVAFGADGRVYAAGRQADGLFAVVELSPPR